MEDNARKKGEVRKVGPGHPPVEHQFKPGHPGGPGRPRTRELTKELRRVLAEDDGKALRAIIRKAVTKARGGDYRFFREIMDRMDGKVPDALDVTSGGDRIGGPDLTKLSERTKRQVLKELGGPEE